jgi:hypothetical protein
MQRVTSVRYEQTVRLSGEGIDGSPWSAAAAAAAEWMAFDLCIDPSDLASSVSGGARKLLATSAVSLMLRLGDTEDYTEQGPDKSYGWDGGAIAVMDDSGCLLATPVGLLGCETKEDPASSPDPTTSTERKSVTFSLQQSGDACTRRLPGRPRRNMLLLLPKFPMLNSPNSACYARIMPNYAQSCRHVPPDPTARPVRSRGRVWQFLLATSWDVINLKTRGFNMRVGYPHAYYM